MSFNYELIRLMFEPNRTPSCGSLNQSIVALETNRGNVGGPRDRSMLLVKHQRTTQDTEALQSDIFIAGAKAGYTESNGRLVDDQKPD